MSKYLKHICTYEKLQTDQAGKVLMDKYGEPLYEPRVVIHCRREIAVQDIQTNTGAILTSSTRYFTDDKHTIHANDKLDGKIVLKVQEYANQFGEVEGFESYV
jgi:hypothetical protein